MYGMQNYVCPNCGIKNTCGTTWNKEKIPMPNCYKCGTKMKLATIEKVKITPYKKNGKNYGINHKNDDDNLGDNKSGYTLEARKQYRKVSKENKTEYEKEKRCRELLKRGYNHDAVAGMMFGEHGSEKGDLAYVKGLQKKKGSIILDGRL
jgi:Zn ribbon nucleic-acid-binding protein